MGYESRLYVVSKSGLRDGGSNLFWAEKIAEFNLCKVDNDVLLGIESLGKPTDCFITYDEDGNPDNTDKYGKVMTEISLDDMVNILEDAIDDSDYRRYPPCLAMLKAFQSQNMYWDDLVVLHYGY